MTALLRLLPWIDCDDEDVGEINDDNDDDKEEKIVNKEMIK